MALATRTEIKAALNISDTDSDAQIDALIEPISALIEREAGRKFSSADVTQRYFGGEPTIALRELPIGSGSPAFTVTDKVTGEVLTEGDDYEVDYDLGLLRRLPIGASWEVASRKDLVFLGEVSPTPRWEISFTAGPNGVPQDIKLAMYLTIGANLDRSAASSGGGGAIGGIIAERDGDYSYQKAASAATSSNSESLSASGLPSAAAAIVRKYSAGWFV